MALGLPGEAPRGRSDHVSGPKPKRQWLHQDGQFSDFTSGRPARIAPFMRLLLVLLVVLPGLAAAQESCIEAPYDSADGVAQSELAALYAEASTALVRFPSLAETVEVQMPQLCISTQMDGAYGYLDVERNRIYVSAELYNDMKLGALLHEIRHLNQLAIGVCPSDDLAMAEYAQATFALEADASAISLLVAWDMKGQGNARAWTALSAWPTQSDIAARFAAEMEATGSAEGAVSAAFDQWFASELRHDLYYRSVCSGYLDRQEASKALPRYQLIPTDFYSKLCKLPDGTRYQCNEPRVKSR